MTSQPVQRLASWARVRTVSPVRTASIGRPAGFARALMWRKYRSALLLFLLAAVGAVIAFKFLTGVWMLVSLAAAVVVLFEANTLRVSGDKARVGVASEETVVRHLVHSNCDQVVLNGLMLGAGGDADHIVLGPHAVVVETKTGFGQLSVHKGMVYSGKRPVGTDPLQQVRRQASAATHILGVLCTPIVCVANAKGAPVSFAGVVVCNASDLPAVIASTPRVLAQSSVAGCVSTLQKVDERVTAQRAAKAGKSK